MKQVTVVIPSLNAKSFISECLDSLRLQTYKNFETVVVENGSTDGSADYLKKNYPEVTVLAQPKNLGFAGGVNVGIKYSDAEYVALLNNDARVDKHWLKELVEFAENNIEAGAVTSKILENKIDKKTGKYYIDTTGDYYSVWGLPFPRARGAVDDGQYDEVTEVFAACGGSVLLRKKALDQIGIFDENFFAYYEDVDLSFRLRLAGWKIFYQPKSVVYHAIGKTSGGGKKPFTRFHSIKNSWLLYLKNMPMPQLLTCMPRYIVMSFLMLVSSIKSGLLGAHTKGIIMAVVYTPSTIGQRVKNFSNKKITNHQLAEMLYKDMPPMQKKSLARFRKRFKVA